MTTWNDTFSGRTVSSNTSGNWGTASGGNAWSCYSGGSSTFAVNSGEGTIAYPSAGNVIMCLSAATGTDMECFCRMSPDNNYDELGVDLRLTDFSHYYRLGLNSQNVLRMGMKSGGGFVELANISTTITYASGTFYWLHFRVIGSTLYGNIWQSGQSEPASWMIVRTDTNLKSGGVGIFANTNASATNAAQFDSFSATTIVSQNILGNRRSIGRIH